MSINLSIKIFDYFASLTPQSIAGRRREISTFTKGGVKLPHLKDTKQPEIISKVEKNESSYATVSEDKEHVSNKKPVTIHVTDKDIKQDRNGFYTRIKETHKNAQEFIDTNPGTSVEILVNWSGIFSAEKPIQNLHTLLEKNIEQEDVESKETDSLQYT